MNTLLFQQAQFAAAGKDYARALSSYQQCLADAANPPAPGEIGQINHQIGNCLIKLKRPTEAIAAYGQALADASYDSRGAVNCNLGMAYAAMHDFNNAVSHFEAAATDAKYGASYKAYTGMGNALLKQGKSAEAGVAFRQAALDNNNPDPTKALLNLGICFMALGRPADAVSSYESALQFNMPANIKNRLCANLGQAYVACGQMQKAVTAFEQAISDKSYYLSDSASVDYQRAIGEVAQGGSSEATQVMDTVSNLDVVPTPADTSGIDVSADGGAMYAQQDPYTNQQEADPYYYSDPYNADVAQYDAQAVDEHFFNSSDEELEKWSRGVAKQKRKKRNFGLKILLAIILLVVVLCGAGIFFYTQGWGYPTQSSVVTQLFASPQNAQELYASDVDTQSQQTITDMLVQDSAPVVDAVERSMNASTVYVTANTGSGGTMHYIVSLVRSGVGWKVSNVELNFNSKS